MITPRTEEKILAQALYDIRLLLSDHLGSKSNADVSIRLAAHLAYALHEDCLSVLADGSFDTSKAVSRIKAIEGIVGNDISANFKKYETQNT